MFMSKLYVGSDINAVALESSSIVARVNGSRQLHVAWVSIYGSSQWMTD